MLLLEVVGLLLMSVGTLFVFVAGLGIWRLPDVYMRLHASTKAGTLGVALIAAGLVVFFPDLGLFTRAVALVLFLLLTAPVSAHMIGQASYFSPDYIGGAIWEGTIVDRRVEHHSGEERASSDELGDPAA